MKKIFLFLLILSSCTITPLTPKEAAQLTPEQIKAYKEMNMDVFECFNISGPPPNGGFSFIIVPKGSKIDFAFSPNCNLLSGKVN